MMPFGASRCQWVSEGVCGMVWSNKLHAMLLIIVQIAMEIEWLFTWEFYAYLGWMVSNKNACGPIHESFPFFILDVTGYSDNEKALNFFLF